MENSKHSGIPGCELLLRYFDKDGYYNTRSDIHKLYSSDNGPFVHLLTLMLIDVAPPKNGEHLLEDKRDEELLKALDEDRHEDARLLLIKWLQEHPSYNGEK